MAVGISLGRNMLHRFCEKYMPFTLLIAQLQGFNFASAPHRCFLLGTFLFGQRAVWAREPLLQLNAHLLGYCLSETRGLGWLRGLDDNWLRG